LEEKKIRRDKRGKFKNRPGEKKRKSLVLRPSRGERQLNPREQKKKSAKGGGVA